MYVFIEVVNKECYRCNLYLFCLCRCNESTSRNQVLFHQR